MKKLTPSQVHYIKAVYGLSSGSRGIRVVDIAEKLGVSKASTSLSMTKLAQREVVYKDSVRHIEEAGLHPGVRHRARWNPSLLC